jgi:hypothetical protein
MAEKATHFGRAGEFYAMSELLLRGWNVAVPVVDVGDDVFVVDDNDKTTYRVQVKTAEAVQRTTGLYASRFTLSRKQLASALNIELFYVLLARVETRWRLIVVPRVTLAELRHRFETTVQTGAGRPRVTAESAKADAIAFDVEINDAENSASGWGESLTSFLDQWPTELAIVAGGPGTRSR